jgi:hypothetical protein
MPDPLKLLRRGDASTEMREWPLWRRWCWSHAIQGAVDRRSGRRTEPTNALRQRFRRVPRLRPWRCLFTGAWAGSRSPSCLWSSTPSSARSCSSGGCCCPACEPPSAGATGSPIECYSPSITCTSRGSYRPPWSMASFSRPIRRSASKAPGWASSCTRFKASS